MTETVSDRLPFTRELKKTLNFHKTVGKTFSYLSLFMCLDSLNPYLSYEISFATSQMLSYFDLI